MDLTTAIALVAVTATILGGFITGAVWVLGITAKISNRAILIERDITEIVKDNTALASRVERVEKDTSFQSLQETFTKIFYTAIQSKEFRQANKEAIKETLLHIESTRTASDAGALHLILEELQELRSERNKNRRNEN